MLRSSSQHVRLVRVRAEEDVPPLVRQAESPRRAFGVGATESSRSCEASIAFAQRLASHRAQFRRRETCGLPHPSRSDNAHARR